jgi:large subunit ribosomal protein L13
MERKTHKINAKGRPLGRLAVEIAKLLRGKGKVEFRSNEDLGDFVVVENFSEVKFTGKKIEQKKYYHYSGYPGGIKEKKLQELFQDDPKKILIKAVSGMMPKNKLTPIQIQRLKIENANKEN